MMRRAEPRSLLAAAAGPLLIVAAALAVLHDYWLGGLFSHLNPDVTVFLHNHCFLGESLRGGNIPAWDPAPLAGLPFAGDPQAGWMYASPMLYYTLLPCHLAFRLFIITPTIVAGLGFYLLLRGEGMSRQAATVAGLAASMMIASSKILVSIPFSDTMAWTPIVLVVAAKAIRACTWASRLAWIAALALAWGQLAAAHLSHGLVVGSTALLVYSAYVAVREMREGRLAARTLAGMTGIALLALPAVNLAHLLPIADFVPRTSFGLSYEGMAEAVAELRGEEFEEIGVSRALSTTWPLRLATAPGVYLGAIPLILMFGGFVSRRTRGLAIAFGAYGAFFAILGLKGVAEKVAPFLDPIPFSDFYPHSPGRLLYAPLMAVAVLAGLGVEAWRDTKNANERIAMIAPGLALWALLPLLAGAQPRRMVFFAVGAVVGAAVLFVLHKKPVLAVAVPVLVAVELVASGLYGQSLGPKPVRDGLETKVDEWLPFAPLPQPVIDTSAYVGGGPVEDTVKDTAAEGRVIILGEGFTWLLRPILSGDEMGHGYNPIHLMRYWEYIRSIVPQPIHYARSIFPKELPPPQALDLLQVGYVATRPKMDPPPDATRVAEDEKHRHVLYRLNDPAPRAQVYTSWEVMEPEAAREAITGAAFRPQESLVLEEEPPVESAGTGGDSSADYRWTSPNDATVEVSSEDEGMLLVRNAYDENWEATVNGEDVDVMQADYFLQAIPVPAGESTVELRYRDASIGLGLAGSAIALLLLLGGAGILRVRGARPGEPGSGAGDRSGPDDDSDSGSQARVLQQSGAR